MTLPNPVFSAFALVGSLLCIISCPWHLTSWNTGAFLYALWTGVACLNQFVNSVIWNHNFIDKAPVFCDISSKLIIGISIGIPTASLCICRRLYIISSLKSFTFSKAETRRSIKVDLMIGLGIPVLIMSLPYSTRYVLADYIVQGHRYDLYEDAGCAPAIYLTWQAYLVILSPPVAIGLVSAVYAVSNIKQFYKIHNRIKLEQPEGGITPTMYFRFVCLSSIEVLCTVPLALFCIIYNLTALDHRFHWISWADTHYAFSKVWFYPSAVWRSPEHAAYQISVEMTRWLNVFCAVVFFAFFGYTDETRKKLRRVLGAVAGWVGFGHCSTDVGATSKNDALAPIHFNKTVENTTYGSIGTYMSTGGVESNPSSLTVGESEKKDDLSTISGDPETLTLNVSNHQESFGKHPFSIIPAPLVARIHHPRSTVYSIDLSTPRPILEQRPRSPPTDDSIV